MRLMLLLAAAEACGALTRGGGQCSGPLDCQLNGACVAGACACSAGWTGPNCSSIRLLPATRGQGLGGLDSGWSSWGNKVLRDPVSGRWFMAADEMANRCGLGAFGSNSRSIVAVAENATGPYVRQQVVVDSFSHGTWMERDPVSGRWILGHMGAGAATRGAVCRVCADGVTPPGAPTAPCPRESAVPASAQAGPLIAASPLGPWESAGSGLINGANCEPFFLPNGTLFFACPWEGRLTDPHCNNQSAGLAISRAETLQDALEGRYSFKHQQPVYLLGGSNASGPCANWEGNNLWIDRNGYFHSLAHAYRGQPCDYPLPGCHNPGMRNASDGVSPCTATGGHSYSIDGRHWFLSPVAAFTSTLEFTDGSRVTFRARERAHVVLDENRELLYLGNGMGNPGRGQNTGVPGADHTFVQLQPVATEQNEVAHHMAAVP